MGGDFYDCGGVVMFLDYFKYMGLNGMYVCMVFEYLGDNFFIFIKVYNYRGLLLYMVK